MLRRYLPGLSESHDHRTRSMTTTIASAAADRSPYRCARRTVLPTMRIRRLERSLRIVACLFRCHCFSLCYSSCSCCRRLRIRDLAPSSIKHSNFLNQIQQDSLLSLLLLLLPCDGALVDITSPIRRHIALVACR